MYNNMRFLDGVLENEELKKFVKYFDDLGLDVELRSLGFAECYVCG